MSKPREVIARAACEAILWPGAWDKMPDAEKEIGYARADAVIDALEKMEVTDKMSRACWENMDGTSWNIWRAMVGAMRDE